MDGETRKRGGTLEIAAEKDLQDVTQDPRSQVSGQKEENTAWDSTQ